jgi:hypothetical protein
MAFAALMTVRVEAGISRILAPTPVSSKVRLTFFKLLLMSPLIIVGLATV